MNKIRANLKPKQSHDAVIEKRKLQSVQNKLIAACMLLENSALIATDGKEMSEEPFGRFNATFICSGKRSSGWEDQRKSIVRLRGHKVLYDSEITVRCQVRLGKDELSDFCQFRAFKQGSCKIKAKTSHVGERLQTEWEYDNCSKEEVRMFRARMFEMREYAVQKL